MTPTKGETKSGPAGPFAYAAWGYLRAGWSPIPVPFGLKASPVHGFTGKGAPHPSGADISEWSDNGKGAWNIALRPSTNTVGIDIDDYADKPGAATLADLEARWGPLPGTWQSSRRLPENTTSGIRWYRLPDGVTTDDWPGEAGRGIELIRESHRYALVSPSKITEDNLVYRWFDQRTGVLLGYDEVPRADDLPTLPQTWCDGLAALRHSSAHQPTGPATDDCSPGQREWLDNRVATLIASVAAAAEGGREKAFNDATLEIGHYARFLDRPQIHARMKEACATNGYLRDHGDYEPKFTHAYDDGAAEPRNLPPDIEKYLLPTPEPRMEPTFWAATPTLRHIQQAAHSHGLGAMALLGAVLARVSMLTHHTIELPGSPNRGSLNFYAGLVGRSGGGKGSSVTIASRLLPAEPQPCMCRDDEHQGDYVVVPPGSGEGVVRSFFDTVSETGSDGKRRVSTKRDRHHILVDVDEIETLLATMGRSGATIGPMLRSLWSGAMTGPNNAAAERRLLLHDGTYRLAMVAGIQPGVVERLFGEEMGGTPQRFCWFPTEDTEIPDLDAGGVLPDWPGELPSVRMEDGGVPWSAFTIEVPESVRHEISVRRNRARRGVETIAALDAHRDFNRLRVAALLARLHEGREITDQWWALAGLVMDVSDATRDWMQDEVARTSKRRIEKRGWAVAVQNEAQAAAVEENVERAAKVIAKAAEGLSEGSDTFTGGSLSRGLGGRLRPYKDQALEMALEMEWVEDAGPTSNGQGRLYRLGKSRPA